MEQKALDTLKANIFDRKATLGSIYTRFQDVSIYDYVNQWPKAALQTSNIFSRHLELLAREIYGEDARQLMSEYNKNSLVSTIDHHGILNHPFFLNSNLIYSLKKDTSCLICLTTTSISLNNSSWPGCLVVGNEEGSALQRLPLFLDKDKNKAVLALRAFNKQDVGRLINRIEHEVSLPVEIREGIKQLVAEEFGTKIFEAKNFSVQASHISTQLWNKFFPQAPKIFYIPLEKLVCNVVIELLETKNELFTTLLCRPEGWEALHKNFLGTPGAFTSAAKGSFLFWGVNSKGERVHMSFEKNKLVGEGAEVALSAQEIIYSLKEGTLYPTTMVCFLVLLYYSVTCLGGFNQVNLLTATKEKFASLLANFGQKDLSVRISSVPTENFAEMDLAFLVRNGNIVKATGVDVYLQKSPNIYNSFVELSKRLTVGQSLEAALPGIYKVITPQTLQNKKLLALTASEIAEFNGAAADGLEFSASNRVSSMRHMNS
jgi:hypothetical protein